MNAKIELHREFYTVQDAAAITKHYSVKDLIHFGAYRDLPIYFLSNRGMPKQIRLLPDDVYVQVANLQKNQESPAVILDGKYAIINPDHKSTYGRLYSEELLDAIPVDRKYLQLYSTEPQKAKLWVDYKSTLTRLLFDCAPTAIARANAMLDFDKAFPNFTKSGSAIASIHETSLVIEALASESLVIRRQDLETLIKGKASIHTETTGKEKGRTSTLLKIIFALAQNKYEFHPMQRRNSIVQDIKIELEQCGLSLDDGTILAVMKAACEEYEKST